MTLVCEMCNKIFDVPNPPDYENMSIIDKLTIHQGTDHALCRECVHKILEKAAEIYDEIH